MRKIAVHVSIIRSHGGAAQFIGSASEAEASRSYLVRDLNISFEFLYLGQRFRLEFIAWTPDIVSLRRGKKAQLKIEP